MGLFSPAWKSKNPQKRLKAVEKLDDQNVLMTLAAQDPSKEVRLAAIPKIKNAAFLIQLAQNIGDFDLSEAAVKHIADQAAIVDLALATDSNHLAIKCLQWLEAHDAGEDVYKNLACKAGNSNIVWSALDKVERDRSQFLFKFTKMSRKTEDKLVAVERLSETGELALCEEVMLSNRSAKVRSAMLDRLSHKAGLDALIAFAMREDNKTDARKAAIATLTGKKLERDYCTELEPLLKDKVLQLPVAVYVGRHGYVSALPVLKANALNPDWHYNRDIVLSLGCIANAGAVEALLQIARADHCKLGGLAVNALGNLYKLHKDKNSGLKQYMENIGSHDIRSHVDEGDYNHCSHSDVAGIHFDLGQA